MCYELIKKSIKNAIKNITKENHENYFTAFRILNAGFFILYKKISIIVINGYK